MITNQNYNALFNPFTHDKIKTLFWTSFLFYLIVFIFWLDKVFLYVTITLLHLSFIFL